MATPSLAVHTLGPAHYKSFLELAAEGQDSLTHKALITFPGSADPVDAYVKVYNDADAPKGLINEVAGYIVARADGLSVPESAAVILLTPEQLQFLRSDATPCMTQDGYIVAWAVQSLGGNTPTQLFDLSSAHDCDTLRRDLSKWPELPQAVSLDHWLLNNDRNLGNVVRVAPGRYALIDHGRICTGNAWKSPLDRQQMQNLNKLALVMWNEPGIEKAPSDAHASILQACDGHVATYASAEQELSNWLDKLLDANEKNDLQEFLSRRTALIPPYLRTAYGVLV